MCEVQQLVLHYKNLIENRIVILQKVYFILKEILSTTFFMSLSRLGNLQPSKECPYCFSEISDITRLPAQCRNDRMMECMIDVFLSSSLLDKGSNLPNSSRSTVEKFRTYLIYFQT